jgi:hypothetical protein
VISDNSSGTLDVSVPLLSATELVFVLPPVATELVLFVVPLFEIELVFVLLLATVLVLFVTELVFAEVELSDLLFANAVIPALSAIIRLAITATKVRIFLLFIFLFLL